ncbi:MAG: ACP S-malonyltransferase [Pseudomonadota bacterium]|nr:ACP S-malonyltransferase [Pseudomonadota bacterium]
MNSYCVIFPGQGSQNPQMLSSYLGLQIFRETIEEASDFLGYNLCDVVDNEKKINKTEFTQPLILTTSIAIWRVWKEKCNFTPDFGAGHSLGEYSALVANGWMSFADCLELVNLRAQYMEEETSGINSGMAAIIGLNRQEISDLCLKLSNKKELIEAVNFNSPQQTVIGGHLNLIEKSIPKFKDAGAKLIKIIPVSVAAHTSLLEKCNGKLYKILKNKEFYKPNYPVFHNVDGQLKDSESDIIDSLSAQIHNPVEWTKTIENISDRGIKTFIEIGPGNVLSSLNKRINKSLNSISIDNYANIGDALELISNE